MQRARVFRLAAGVAMLLAWLTASASHGAAQGADASLTIHHRLCPTEYSGDDIFGDCHGNPQTSGLTFAISGPVSDSGPIDANGDITFGGLPAGAYEISGGVAADLARLYVYCSVDGDPFNVLPVTPTATGVGIGVPGGAAVLCDWYTIPYDLSDQGDEAGDDGNGAEDPPLDAAVEPADDPPPLVSIPIVAYNCTRDPGPHDPAILCDPAPGVTVEVTQDDESLGSVSTDAGGFATIDAEEGATVVITVEMGTVSPGYVPVSGGVRTIESVADGAGAVFVHVRVGAENAGRLQIVNGSCPTSREERTEFNVIGPAPSTGASSAPCLPTPDAPFTIDGRRLPGRGLVVSTGDDGAWRGALPAGSYTVTDDSGAAQAVEVRAGETTVVTAVDYVPFPDGTLVVTKYLCTEGEEAGTTITVDEAPGDVDPGCAPSDGEFRLEEVSDGTAGPVEDFTLGPDGTAEFTLRTGDYLLTDLASQQTVTVTIAESTITTATVRQVVL